MDVRLKQHQLLTLLVIRFTQWDKDKIGSFAVDFDTIYKELKCDKYSLHIISAVLFSENEIALYDVGFNGIRILEKGISAYSSNKYKIERHNLIVGKIKDYLGISAATLTILTAIISMYIAITSVNKNQAQIERLQKQVDKMQPYKKIETQTKNPHDSVSSKN